MQSTDVIFTGTDQVEVQGHEVRPPGEGEMLVQATKSLISTGTECIGLGHLFEPGTFSATWPVATCG